MKSYNHAYCVLTIRQLNFFAAPTLHDYLMLFTLLSNMMTKHKLKSKPKISLEQMDDIDSEFSNDDFDGYVDSEKKCEAITHATLYGVNL